MYKWFSAHYHACRAMVRLRTLERHFTRFRLDTHWRLNNHNACIESITRYADRAFKQSAKVADQLELNDAGQRQHGRDIVDLSEQIVTLTQRLDYLVKAIDQHNKCLETLNDEVARIRNRKKLGPIPDASLN